MRWIYLGAIVLFAVATLIFALQNLEAVTMASSCTSSAR